jgi:hypothetical protein
VTACHGVRRPLWCRAGRQWAVVVAALNGRSAEPRAQLVAAPIAEALAVGAHKPLASSVVRVLAAMWAVAAEPAMTREPALVGRVMPE